MKDQLTITLVQTQLFWEDKQANLKMFEEKISSISCRTEIIVIPEMFSTGFTMNAKAMAETMAGPSVEWMKRVAAQNKVIITGSLIIKEENDEGVEACYNRLIWMLPNGQYGIYDKRHLFAYASEDDHYTAGAKRLIASVKNWKINLQVCYDLRFPVWARQTPGLAPSSGEEIPPTPEYDVLIYVANWPERRSHAWKTLLQARAIENQCYVIGVNRVGNDGNGIYHSGDSMVVDPLGEVLYHKKDDEDIYTITLEKGHLNTIREKFPFLRDADDFKIF